jgi:hypothetical protein
LLSRRLLKHLFEQGHLSQNRFVALSPPTSRTRYPNRELLENFSTGGEAQLLFQFETCVSQPSYFIEWALYDVITVFTFVFPRRGRNNSCRFRTELATNVPKLVFSTFYAPQTLCSTLFAAAISIRGCTSWRLNSQSTAPSSTTRKSIG